MSSWIKMLSDEMADTELKQALDEARTPHGTVDNVLRVHSLRPNTMKGHMALYKSCLHDDTNTLPEWLQETISFSAYCIKASSTPVKQSSGFLFFNEK